MLKEYFPILLQIIVAIGLAAGALIASLMLGKRGSHNKAKDAPYECGMDPIGPANPRFSVKFYLIAMLFILFDIEIVFLYPWAVIYKHQIVDLSRWTILWSMVSFTAVLCLGYLYAFKKGALDWSR